jgi:alpha-D-xyloside xylohydrolase
MPDVIRVQARHHHPKEIGPTCFDLDYGLTSAEVRIDDQPEHTVFSSGKLSLRICKNGPWEMDFVDDAGARVACGDHESLGYMNVSGAGNFVMQRLSMGVGECIYGLGERFGPLVKNGQTVETWNEDGGTNSDHSYKCIPFYLSSRGYGLLVNSPAKVEFEIGTERVTQVQLAAPGEALDYYVFYGPDPKDVVEKYTRLSGRPAVPPAWSFGLWLSTSFTTQYDEKTVTEFVDGMREREIPLSVFHFDCFWMRQRHWCDFEWDREKFPDPAAMLKRLKAKGLKISVWINPYVSQMSRLFDEGRAKGYFVKRRDGSVYQADQWQPGMAYVDFTNPHALAWYQAKLRHLLDMGVDSFKTDFGERIPFDDNVVYHDGADPRLMRNYYCYLYNRAVFELLESYHGKGEALVFARAATTGCQKFPVHWGGDCEATFESMAEDLRGGLSFCMSGPAFWSHDIGGFTGTANAALYKRWVAFGLLSTHSRLHGSSSYRVPWLFDEESVAVMRHFARLKNRLFPYLFAAAHDAAERGHPVMRAMVLEYPDDPACRYLDRQYMLGSALLVAPVFRQDNLAEYYLPEGRWTDLVTGQLIEGGQWRTHVVDFMHVPLFGRENSMIPMSDAGDGPAWSVNDELTLQVMQISDGADVLANAVTSDDATRVTFRCSCDGDTLTFLSSGQASRVRVMLRGRRDAPSDLANGTLVAEKPEGVLLEWDDPAKPMVVMTGVAIEIEHLKSARPKVRPALLD